MEGNLFLIEEHIKKCGDLLLEVGANTGDITQQLAVISDIKIDALEHSPSTGLTKRFSGSSNVDTLILDYFKLGDMTQYHAKYDIVLLKEWFNAFGQERYYDTIEVADLVLKKNGKIIIIDYFPRVLYRQFICAVVLRPWRIRGSYIAFKSQKGHRLLDEASLNGLIGDFPNLRKDFHLYSNVDPLNLYDGRMHKILEFVFPCKFCAVISKNNS